MQAYLKGCEKINQDLTYFEINIKCVYATRRLDKKIWNRDVLLENLDDLTLLVCKTIEL